MSKIKIYSSFCFVVLIFMLTSRVCLARSTFPSDNKIVSSIDQSFSMKVNLVPAYVLPRDNISTTTTSRTFTQTVTSNTNQITNWKLGRVTKKHYEVINMLWRKTKIFVNVENDSLNSKEQYNNTTYTSKYDSNVRKIPITLSPWLPVTQTSTPSNIEFYYLNENDDQLKWKDCGAGNCTTDINKILDLGNFRRSNSSFLVFHIKSPLKNDSRIKYSQTAIPSSTHLNNLPFIMHAIKSFESEPKIPHKSAHSYASKLSLNPSIRKNTESNRSLQIFSKNANTKKKYLENLMDPIKAEWLNVTEKVYGQVGILEEFTATTEYDKIKFFEIYDQYTQIPYSKEDQSKLYSTENLKVNQEINNEQTILLSHVDQNSHSHNTSKHTKKHISENHKNVIPYIKKPVVKGHYYTTFYSTRKKQTKSTVSREFKTNSYNNTPALWNEYPFAAVYIYEPSQVYCDAAAISAHWLVASGSCLSRLNKIPNDGDRSAFVAYCGPTWWPPERVAYVKNTIVHPSFSTINRNKKHLFNIGLIEVVTSMLSACGGWSPVTIMSHQFTAGQHGSQALALGWGLDRFDTRYSFVDLPKFPLSIYKSLLFTDTCPGNIEHSKAKRLDEGSGVKNVYCLSLPPYSGEDNDPIHGGLLLLGGKLIALYLQEERRPWGEQSAQYTGTWRLISWVTDIAREPEEMEQFSV